MEACEVVQVPDLNGNRCEGVVDEVQFGEMREVAYLWEQAVGGIDEQRAIYGAVMNRLEYTIDNLRNVSMNQMHSRSRIQDADYAKETSELARTQIIQQAATAMLSQANTLQSAVLQLLQGQG